MYIKHIDIFTKSSSVHIAYRYTCVYKVNGWHICKNSGFGHTHLLFLAYTTDTGHLLYQYEITWWLHYTLRASIRTYKRTPDVLWYKWYIFNTIKENHFTSGINNLLPNNHAKCHSKWSKSNAKISLVNMSHKMKSHIFHQKSLTSHSGYYGYMNEFDEFYWPFKGSASFVDLFYYYFCFIFVFAML